MQPRAHQTFTKRFLEMATQIQSWHPVERNGWIIKFSQYDNSNILLLIVSQATGQTIIRYFSHEDGAVVFINKIVKLNPSQMCDL